MRSVLPAMIAAVGCGSAPALAGGLPTDPQFNLVRPSTTGIPGEEMIQTEEVVELVRTVLGLSPRARVPNIVIERVGEVV